MQDAGGDLKDCPWKLPTAESAPRTAASAQPLAPQSTILRFGPDGSLDLGQLKDVFGMELGKTVALKKDSEGKVFPVSYTHLTLPTIYSV